MRVALLCLLLASCSRGTPPGPAALVFEQDVVDVGRVSAGEESLLVLRWRRVGAGPLRVLAVESDCGCALASGPAGLQPAGAQGEVLVRLRGRTRPGPFRHRVTLYTDQPAPRDAVRVLLRGWIEAPASVSPPVLDLGPRSPGARLRREAELRLASTSPAGLAPEALTARLVGLEGSVRVLPPVRLDLPGRLLRVALRTPDTAGRFDARVLVEHAGEVLVTLRIRGVVEAGPTPRRSAHPGRVRPR